MKKYWHVINIGLQNTLVYRVNFLFRSVFGLIPLMATIYLWRAIYSGKESNDVAGYTLASMTSYYLIVTLVDMLTAVNEDDWQIAADIREGTLNQFLLKPIDYLTYRLCLFGAGRLIYTAIALVPVLIFILVQADISWRLRTPGRSAGRTLRAVDRAPAFSVLRWRCWFWVLECPPSSLSFLPLNTSQGGICFHWIFFRRLSRMRCISHRFPISSIFRWDLPGAGSGKRTLPGAGHSRRR
jgi:hypothetical protein